MGDYPPLSMDLTFKGTKHDYQVFVGKREPCEEQGNIGDLYFLTSDPKKAHVRIQDKLGRQRDDTDKIFFKTTSGWTEAPCKREGLNSTPTTMHPVLNHNYRLDDYFCLWKSKTWYTTDRGKSAIQNIISQAKGDQSARYFYNISISVCFDVRPVEIQRFFPCRK